MVPSTSSAEYPVVRVKAGLTQTSGSSGCAGSEMVKDRSVAMTARSRTALACAASTSCAPGAGVRPGPVRRMKTTMARPLIDSPSGKPVTQSGPTTSSTTSSPAVASSCRRRSPAASSEALSESRRISSPATGSPRATRDNGLTVARSDPSGATRPAWWPHSSTPTGRATSPAMAIALRFAYSTRVLARSTTSTAASASCMTRGSWLSGTR